jgi:hypothetical protein
MPARAPEGKPLAASLIGGAFDGQVAALIVCGDVWLTPTDEHPPGAKGLGERRSRCR